MIMNTFVGGFDFTGTTVYPFVTYAVSGLGSTERVYADACPGAQLGPGLAVRGEEVTRHRPDVEAWLAGTDYSPDLRHLHPSITTAHPDAARKEASWTNDISAPWRSQRSGSVAWGSAPTTATRSTPSTGVTADPSGAHDLGVTFFDTAEAYGPFGNETLVGGGLAADPRPGRDRHQVRVRLNGRQPAPAWTAGPNTSAAPSTSLRRLRTDRIDLLYQHRVDPNVPIEDVAGTVKELIDAGKVGHFGLSEAGATRSAAPTPSSPSTAVQSEYSIWAREPEAEVLPACAELGIGFVPWSPARPGLPHRHRRSWRVFAGNDIRSRFPRFTPEALDGEPADRRPGRRHRRR